MAKKSTRSFRMPPLRDLEVRPVTDPAEVAALEAEQKRQQEAGGGGGAKNGPVPAGPVTVARALEWFRQLPADDRPLLAARLAAELSPDEQFTVLEQWVTGLPPEVLPRLEEHLRQRLQKRPH